MAKLRTALRRLRDDWQRVSTLVTVCLLPLMLFSQSLWAQQPKVRNAVAPVQLRRAVGCLVAADYVQQYGLKTIGLRVGDTVWIRYGIGSIPGIGGTPGVWNIVIYSRSGRRGTLLFADPNSKGGFEAIRNGYDLRKQDSHWSASNGEGGFYDYRAIGRYATVLSHEPRYHVTLAPGGPECTRD